MAKIELDLNKRIGKIKPMHAVGQGPIGGSGTEMFNDFHYLTEAGCPYSRLHDVFGPFGSNRFVDIPNIFRDFEADENDPASYDFTFTDALIEALVKAGVEPYYRLGITIENNTEIKAYNTAPPKDPRKWARICEHIIAHYIDGWADGYHYKITYWEIWNEPDDGMRVASEMWSGTKEEYYELYDITARHLKSIYGDRIKVGGYAAVNFNAAILPEEYKNDPRSVYYVEFFHGFMEYIKKSGAPLDFFSWHSYSVPTRALLTVNWIRGQLDGYGFKDTEIHLNEWNPIYRERGTDRHGAYVSAMMLGMQKAPADLLVFYDARKTASVYGGFFDPYYFKPWHAYYAVVAFNHLYRLGYEVYSECDTDGVYVVAATDGKRSALVISNISESDCELDISGADLCGARYHVIDRQRLLSWSPEVKVLEKNQVVLIEL